MSVYCKVMFYIYISKVVSVLKSHLSFQTAPAKILAIWKACDYLQNLINPPVKVAIATDSQATGLSSFTVMSLVIKSCLETLQNATSRIRITLI